MRYSTLPLILASLPYGLAAQVPQQRDSARVDTAAVTRLPDVNVTVTRSEAPLERVPYAVGTLDRDDLQRGQQTLGVDEALNNLPGVVVSNRYNFSLDQRISIRGFGARSNFGVRGLKILLDGVPQTLPDGQSQLTNVEFGNIGRVEVLRGSSSSLHGNAAGGAISFISEPAAPGPFGQRVRIEGGGTERENDDYYKWQSWTSGRSGPLSGTLSISQFKTDGFRQHSAAEIRQANLGLDYLVAGSTIATLRLGLADNPRAQNPGALTRTEYDVNPDSAARNNILRGADKDVQQQQLALGLRHFDPGGNEYAATVYGLLRDLKNPIAAPPPDGIGPNTGTYIGIDRAAGGARLTGTRRLGTGPALPRLSFGADIQRMRDDRTELRSVDGAPTDSTLLDQRETITEIGPFVQALWNPEERLLLSAGARYDWVRFSVDDAHLTDGADDSGARTMDALSGNLGASWTFEEWAVVYGNVSSSFETPTTTELKNRPDGSAGFNNALEPQRAANYEIGVRGQPLPDVSYSASFFLGRISDAIVQGPEIGGRAFFRNAGKVHNAGAEVGLTVTPVRRLTVSGAYTYARYRFAEYVDAAGVSYEDNRVPGVPEHFWRFGIRSALPYDLYVDADHTISSSVAADDANTLFVESRGAGVTNLRLGWSGNTGRVQVSPFLGVNNLWDRRYVGSVTLNGVGGRVFEPAPRRLVYLGAELGYRSLR